MRIHDLYVATLGSVSARRTDVITHPTMNRASGTNGTDTSKAKLNKTLDYKTLGAAEAPTEFLPGEKH